MNYQEFKNQSTIKNQQSQNINSVEKYNDVKEQIAEFEHNYEASREDWEQLTAVFNEVVENLKYDDYKINTAAKSLDWKYFNTQDRTINIDDVIKTATSLFEDICKKNNGTGTSSSGGVRVKTNLITKQVYVDFIISENYAFWDEITNSVEY